jgi:hypothetical protein
MSSQPPAAYRKPPTLFVGLPEGIRILIYEHLFRGFTLVIDYGPDISDHSHHLGNPPNARRNLVIPLSACNIQTQTRGT